MQKLQWKGIGCVVAVAGLLTVSNAALAGGSCAPHWDGSIGQPGVPGEGFPHPQIRAIAEWNGNLVAGGAHFQSIGGIAAQNIALFDGTQWHALGSGVSGENGNEGVVAMIEFDGDLIVGGDFTNAGDVPGTQFIARWDGKQWSPLGSGVDWTVESLAVFDDGNGAALFAGGWFTHAGGNVVNHVAKWDGKQWSALNTGVRQGPFPIPSVIAMTVFDDGSGPALYISGSFGIADGVPGTARVARWDGKQFSPLGIGVSDDVYGITSVDAGEPGGPALYVGGWFFQVNGQPGANVAKWDGSTWEPLAQSVNGAVRAVAVFDDGSGPSLYAAGWFTSIDGQPFNRIARWDAALQQWDDVDGGASLDVTSLLVPKTFGAGGPPAMYMGGLFTSVGGEDAFRVAARVGCAVTPGDLDGDGSVGVPDLLLLLAAWGECDDCTPGKDGTCAADLDDDCNVGVADLLILLANWG